MAATKGHGNPHWTRDEVILALDLYFECNGKIPGPSDPRVIALSALLRAFPHHSAAARRESFRNPDGVGFKLQNLRQLETGKGLSNVSRTDRDVWNELGHDRARTKELAKLIRTGIDIVQTAHSDSISDDVFAEGKVVTETHFRRERNPVLRKRLLDRKRKLGELNFELCGSSSSSHIPHFAEAVFEAHHLIPLSVGQERETKLEDLALLCANCHRMVHRAIALAGKWLSIEDASIVIYGMSQPRRS